MKIQIPEFLKDKHFRELSPKEGKNKYRFITTRCLIVGLSGIVPCGTKISFRDKNGKEWLYIDHKHFIIHKNYAWDGCTPKKHIPIFGWVGTPDFEKTILASLIHDAFCQFQDTKDFPFSRYIIDNIFKYILIENNFEWVDIYYLGVRVGSYFHKEKKDVISILII